MDILLNGGAVKVGHSCGKCSSRAQRLQKEYTQLTYILLRHKLPKDMAKIIIKMKKSLEENDATRSIYFNRMYVSCAFQDKEILKQNRFNFDWSIKLWYIIPSLITQSTHELISNSFNGPKRMFHILDPRETTQYDTYAKQELEKVEDYHEKLRYCIEKAPKLKGWFNSNIYEEYLKYKKLSKIK